MKNKLKICLRKLLGSGRAWACQKGFTADLLEVIAEPLDEVKNRIENIKKTHFPTQTLDVYDIENAEEMFGLIPDALDTLIDRANRIESQWTLFSGFKNYDQLQTILSNKGLPVKVIESVPNTGDERMGKQAIANAPLNIAGTVYEPVVITTDDGVFFVKALDFLSNEQLSLLINTVAKYKQAHLAAYYLPHYFLKGDIDDEMTKEEMENYFKYMYCSE